MHQLTAAHKTLAFGSVVKVSRRDTGADVKVRINDRGPFIEGRIIDLSYAAARKIDLDVDGVAPVKIKVVGHAETPAKKPPSGEGPEDCFWVQVGAFGESANADRAEAELERSGETEPGRAGEPGGSGAGPQPHHRHLAGRTHRPLRRLTSDLDSDCVTITAMLNKSLFRLTILGVFTAVSLAFACQSTGPPEILAERVVMREQPIWTYSPTCHHPFGEAVLALPHAFESKIRIAA